MGSFDDLSTERFRKKLTPYLDAIYVRVFGEHETILTNGNLDDKSFAVDRTICLSSGKTIATQEKIRNYDALKWGDFTQEYKNGVGTRKESEGEWFHLYADLYFYGWATPAQDALARWFVMDVDRYKQIVVKAGGIEQVGSYRVNFQHGRASFFAIPLWKIRDAFITDSSHPLKRSRRLMHQWLRARFYV